MEFVTGTSCAASGKSHFFLSGLCSLVYHKWSIAIIKRKMLYVGYAIYPHCLYCINRLNLSDANITHIMKYNRLFYLVFFFKLKWQPITFLQFLLWSMLSLTVFFLIQFLYLLKSCLDFNTTHCSEHFRMWSYFFIAFCDHISSFL